MVGRLMVQGMEGEVAIRGTTRRRARMRGGWAKAVVAVVLGMVAGATLFARKADGEASGRDVEKR